MRYLNQNQLVELRALQDKRKMEQKEIALAQDKLADSIRVTRSLQSTVDTLKTDMTNQVNIRQSLEKFQEQQNMQAKVMK